MTAKTKTKILERLLWADGFAAYISDKYSSVRRYGLEGAESFIPGMKALIDALIDNGASGCVIGKPHRGRHNLLSNILHMPLEHIFAEFNGEVPEYSKKGIHQDFLSDVKSHHYCSYKKKLPDGKTFDMEILPNPSHLECVNPVAMGKVRAL